MEKIEEEKGKDSDASFWENFWKKNNEKTTTLQSPIYTRKLPFGNVTSLRYDRSKRTLLRHMAPCDKYRRKIIYFK